MADSDNRMTYDGYLRIQDLLSLQDGPQGYMPKPCNNEMHFIVVHQAFELWFKVILREFDEIHKKMSQDVSPRTNNSRVSPSLLPMHFDHETDGWAMGCYADLESSRVSFFSS